MVLNNLRETSGGVIWLQTGLFLTSGVLRRSQTTCRKLPEESFDYKQPAQDVLQLHLVINTPVGNLLQLHLVINIPVGNFQTLRVQL